MSTKTDKPIAPKTKAPRRPPAEVAADLYARAEAARIRGIKAEHEYQSLELAHDALQSIDTTRFNPDSVAQINAVTKLIGGAIKEVLAPPSTAKATTGIRQTTIEDA